MASLSVTAYQCPYCTQRPYIQRGRLNRHMKMKHPREFKEDMDRLVDPNIHVNPLPAPVGTVPDGYDQLVQLSHPLTSFETRLKTTNRVEEEDYDSPEELEGVDSGLAMDIDTAVDLDTTMDLDMDWLPTAQHQINYPDDVLILGIDETYRTRIIQDIWKPFRSGYEFRLARWFVDANVPKRHIDSFFNDGLARTPPPVTPGGADGESFTSAYTLAKLLDDLDPDLSINSWKIMAVDHVGTGLIEFRYRSVEAMIRNIFKQPSHEPYMVYMPVKDYDGPDRGYRLLSGIHTGDWWWRMQVSIFLLLLVIRVLIDIGFDPQRPLCYTDYPWFR